MRRGPAIRPYWNPPGKFWISRPSIARSGSDPSWLPRAVDGRPNPRNRAYPADKTLKTQLDTLTKSQKARSSGSLRSPEFMEELDPSLVANVVGVIALRAGIKRPTGA